MAVLHTECVTLQRADEKNQSRPSFLQPRSRSLKCNRVRSRGGTLSIAFHVKCGAEVEQTNKETTNISCTSCWNRSLSQERWGGEIEKGLPGSTRVIQPRSYNRCSVNSIPLDCHETRIYLPILHKLRLNAFMTLQQNEVTFV